MRTVSAVVLLVLAVLLLVAAPFVFSVARSAAERIRVEEKACLAAQSWFKLSLSPPCRLPVESVRWSDEGRDVRFSLPTGACLRLRCFWPRRVEVTHLVGAVFRDDLGWIIDAEVPNGDRVRFYAWRAMYFEGSFETLSQ